MPSVVRTSGLRRRAQALGESLLEAVYPRRCALCHTSIAGDDAPLCPACREAVEAASRHPACPRCGMTLAPFAGPACVTCAQRTFPFDSVVRVGAYTGGLRALLTAFKFGGHEELDVYFAERLARVIMRLEVYEEIDALVAVPTCWQHRLRRSFHPAAVLARLAARRCRIPLAPLLVRRGGPHQVGLSLTARQANVRGRFHLARGCAVPGARLLLVDDVMTTGATAGECTRVLRRAGADAVHVAVVGRAGDDPVTLRHV
ncbi:MAG TPA: double zinc ribbon domain-containing protein [Phycisphaerae bacterium]|nr:ComF family protein [Phycisphaerales bacterium]HRX85910.1 double zinc ribbon domain-containing protein [Phycisphaerae bacterium]